MQTFRCFLCDVRPETVYDRYMLIQDAKGRDWLCLSEPSDEHIYGDAEFEPYRFYLYQLRTGEELGVMTKQLGAMMSRTGLHPESLDIQKSIFDRTVKVSVADAQGLPDRLGQE